MAQYVKARANKAGDLHSIPVTHMEGEEAPTVVLTATHSLGHTAHRELYFIYHILEIYIIYTYRNIYIFLYFFLKKPKVRI